MLFTWYDNRDERTKMPTCNLVEMVHNKMIGMYKVTTDDLIYVFMKIANHILWLKREFIGRGHDSTSLKLKVATNYIDPKILTCANDVFFWGGHKILTLWIVPWKARSYLGPPNGSETCHPLPIISHINLKRWITQFLALIVMLKGHE